MKKYLNIAVKGFYAGLMIAIAGTVYLSVENTVIGALLFSFGLLSVIYLELKLFTGVIGDFLPKMLEKSSVKEKLNWWLETAIILISNFVGTGFLAVMLRLTRIYDKLADRLAPICETKMTQTVLSTFVLAIFCGLIMFIVVNLMRKERTVVTMTILILGIAVFILCGFEHSIANSYYYFAARDFSVNHIWSLLNMVAGNLVGAGLGAVMLLKKKEE